MTRAVRRRKRTGRKAARRPAPTRRKAWGRWPDQRLLDLRLCELGVRLEGSWVERCVKSVWREMERRGIRLRPHAWLSEEWFSPAGVPGVAVPFYLVHPRLMRLERRQMLEVEGGTREECVKILRHEMGHAIQHAYRLSRRRRWRELFGSSAAKYPQVYRPNPTSRRYVQHLRVYYAQSHPDEDFAETFAVWLQPRAVWRKRYEGWPARRKLEYVDELMREIGPQSPPVRARRRVEPVEKIRKTLRRYYDEKRAHYDVGYPQDHDAELRQLFAVDPQRGRGERASRFLRRHRAEVRRLVSRWTGQYQFTLDQVMADMIGRCRELKLRVSGSERRLLMDFAVLLTVKTLHLVYRRSTFAL